MRAFEGAVVAAVDDGVVARDEAIEAAVARDTVRVRLTLSLLLVTAEGSGSGSAAVPISDCAAAVPVSAVPISSGMRSAIFVLSFCLSTNL